MAILRLDKMETTDAFQSMASAVQAPLPWTEDEYCAGRLRDANGRVVLCALDRSDPEASAILALVICAVNTCGGFRASLVDQP
jgi:hypothetical protein